MEQMAYALFREALQLAIGLLVPVTVAVAIVGIAVGIAQTLVQVQDQNVAFAPKILTVGALCAIAGPAALAAVRELLMHAVAALTGAAHA